MGRKTVNLLSLLQRDVLLSSILVHVPDLHLCQCWENSAKCRLNTPTALILPQSTLRRHILARRQTSLEIFPDLMDNKACNEYAALPERLYVVLDGKIIFEGEPGPYGYKLDGVEKLLKKYSSKMN